MENKEIKDKNDNTEETKEKINKDDNIKEIKETKEDVLKDNYVNNQSKINTKSKLPYVIIVLLSIIILILLIMLLSGKGVNNLKQKETVVSSKTVEEESNLKQAIQKVYNSGVYIEVTSNSGMFGSATKASGSGFVYKTDDKNGYILTNNHVISGANDINVTYTDGTSTEAKVVGSDEFTDIAVLKVDVKTVKGKAELGSSNSVELGDTLFTIGAPLGKDYMGTITKGILSGKNRMVKVTLDSGSYLMETLQTDATINSGNSGGPLCNIAGQVVGVNSSKLVGDGIEGMGFSIPIDSVKSILDKLESGKSIDRPYLGVQLSEIDNTFGLQYYYNISIGKDVTFGAVLSYVESGKTADKAGLKVGDVIVEMDGTKIDDTSHFRYNLYKHSIGDTIKLKYYRGNELKSVSIKLTDKIE